MLSFVLMVGVSGDLSIANLLVSVLVILGLLWTIRANMASVYRERAEAAEEELKTVTQEKMTLVSKVAGLESRPDVTQLYTFMVEHDSRERETWQDVIGAIEKQTVILDQISEKLI